MQQPHQQQRSSKRPRLYAGPSRANQHPQPLAPTPDSSQHQCHLQKLQQLVPPGALALINSLPPDSPIRADLVTLLLKRIYAAVHLGSSSSSGNNIPPPPPSCLTGVAIQPIPTPPNVSGVPAPALPPPIPTPQCNVLQPIVQPMTLREQWASRVEKFNSTPVHCQHGTRRCMNTLAWGLPMVSHFRHTMCSVYACMHCADVDIADKQSSTRGRQQPHLSPAAK
jgi:hypothetical protein